MKYFDSHCHLQLSQFDIDRVEVLERMEEGRFGVEPASRERGKNLVKEFVAQVLDADCSLCVGAGTFALDPT